MKIYPLWLLALPAAWADSTSTISIAIEGPASVATQLSQLEDMLARGVLDEDTFAAALHETVLVGPLVSSLAVLGSLRTKGQLTDDEFTVAKGVALSRHMSSLPARKGFAPSGEKAAAAADAAAEINALTQLHETGQITDEEFGLMKSAAIARHIGSRVVDRKKNTELRPASEGAEMNISEAAEEEHSRIEAEDTARVHAVHAEKETKIEKERLQLEAEEAALVQAEKEKEDDQFYEETEERLRLVAETASVAKKAEKERVEAEEAAQMQAEKEKSAEDAKARTNQSAAEAAHLLVQAQAEQEAKAEQAGEGETSGVEIESDDTIRTAGVNLVAKLSAQVADAAIHEQAASQEQAGIYEVNLKEESLSRAQNYEEEEEAVKAKVSEDEAALAKMQKEEEETAKAEAFDNEEVLANPQNEEEEVAKAEAFEEEAALAKMQEEEEETAKAKAFENDEVLAKVQNEEEVAKAKTFEEDKALAKVQKEEEEAAKAKETEEEEVLVKVQKEEEEAVKAKVTDQEEVLANAQKTEEEAAIKMAAEEEAANLGATEEVSSTTEGAKDAGRNHESVCVGWRQTGGCTAFGPREEYSDRECRDEVPAGASGYCECAGGRRVAESTCDHGAFVCEAMCANKCQGWRQTGGCTPDGPREDHSDLPCDKEVPAGSSGYCECANGRRAAESDCDHGPFMCAMMCAE